MLLTTVMLSRLVVRRRLGPSRQTRVLASAYPLAGWLFAVLCCFALLWRPGPFFPSADTVLPLPDGLRAAVNPTGTTFGIW